MKKKLEKLADIKKKNEDLTNEELEDKFDFKDRLKN